MVVVAIFLLTLQSVKDTVALSTSASDAIVSTAESASHALVDDEASFLKFNPGAVVIHVFRQEDSSKGTAVGILDQNHPMLLGPNPFDTAWGSCNPGRPLS